MTGIEGVDEGRISISKNQEVSYLEQHSLVETTESVYDYIYNGQKEIKALANSLKELEEKLSDPETADFDKIMTRYGNLQEVFMEKNGYVVEESIKSISTGLGISYLLDQPIASLSGGQQTLAKLARCLLENKEILLLDEPTNHLDTNGLNWLENYLKHSKQTVVIVSHDRYFLDQVAQKIVYINQQKISSYHGNYSAFKIKRDQELIELEKNYNEQQKEIKQTEDAIRRFRHWGAISDNEKHFKKAKRLEEKSRSGKEVIMIDKLSKSFDEIIIFEELSFPVYRKEHVAIIGGNGVGKSTLIKMILGKEKLDSGEIKVGDSVSIGYLSQVINYEDKKQSILSYFKEKVFLPDEEARRILSYFKFFKEDVFKQIGNLSGGEKVRLELASMMNQEINCLILDEPTNHLDIETREWLEEQLEAFSGTILMVSHDRYFVDKIATKRVVLENKTGKIQV
jgi:ATPase subunit of ABC transporter with duplicated ATPase domains